MSIVKWTLFSELDPVERRVRQLLERAAPAATPLEAADVYETPDEYVFALDVPGIGVDTEQVKASFTEGVLEVRVPKGTQSSSCPCAMA